MKRTLGRQEAQMLAYLQMRNRQVVGTGDLQEALGLSQLQERELLRRMARGGLIARVRRGLYLAPSRLPLGGSWSPSQGLALQTLIEDRAGSYQVCGPNAFNRYGFDEQIPNRVYSYNNRISGERTIGSIALTLIKVNDSRLGDTESLQEDGDQIAVYSSRTRTLVDAVYDWSRFNSLPRAYSWIRRDLAEDRVPPRELVGVTCRYGDIATIRRIGALLDREGMDPVLLGPLRRKLKPTTASIPWDPTQPKRGTGDRQWGIVWNTRD